MNPRAGATDLLVFEARPFSRLGTPPRKYQLLHYTLNFVFCVVVGINFFTFNSVVLYPCCQILARYRCQALISSCSCRHIRILGNIGNRNIHRLARICDSHISVQIYGNGLAFHGHIHIHLKTHLDHVTVWIYNIFTSHVAKVHAGSIHHAGEARRT